MKYYCNCEDVICSENKPYEGYSKCCCYCNIINCAVRCTSIHIGKAIEECNLCVTKEELNNIREIEINNQITHQYKKLNKVQNEINILEDKLKELNNK